LDYEFYSDIFKSLSLQGFLLSNVFFELERDELDRLKALELFDEWEELVLKSSHYFVLTATRGSCSFLLPASSCQVPGEMFACTAEQPLIC
jgi:hypothetical protein